MRVLLIEDSRMVGKKGCGVNARSPSSSCFQAYRRSFGKSCVPSFVRGLPLMRGFPSVNWFFPRASDMLAAAPAFKHPISLTLANFRGALSGVEFGTGSFSTISCAPSSKSFMRPILPKVVQRPLLLPRDIPAQCSSKRENPEVAAKKI